MKQVTLGVKKYMFKETLNNISDFFVSSSKELLIIIHIRHDLGKEIKAHSKLEGRDFALLITNSIFF